jgi:excisionase family DNA binding protein
MDTDEKWVGVEGVTEHLDVTKDTIYRWIKDRNFPSHKAGNLLRFKLSEVDEWVRRDDSAENKKTTKE